MPGVPFVRNIFKEFRLDKQFCTLDPNGFDLLSREVLFTLWLTRGEDGNTGINTIWRTGMTMIASRAGNEARRGKLFKMNPNQSRYRNVNWILWQISRQFALNIVIWLGSSPENSRDLRTNHNSWLNQTEQYWVPVGPGRDSRRSGHFKLNPIRSGPEWVGSRTRSTDNGL